MAVQGRRSQGIKGGGGWVFFVAARRYKYFGSLPFCLPVCQTGEIWMGAELASAPIWEQKTRANQHIKWWYNEEVADLTIPPPRDVEHRTGSGDDVLPMYSRIDIITTGRTQSINPRIHW